MSTNVRVKIKDGELEGEVYEFRHLENRSYYGFRGIPYAKPPVGELRFKAPVLVEPWEGIKDATKDGNQCFSRDMVSRTNVQGSEDCLYLNVYTTKLPDNGIPNPKPVIVFIHGGSFTAGSNSKYIYGPDYLLENDDVVLVVINYRLGLLGFLWAEDPTLGIPGNAGLKDQVLALKWVQQNISAFNGDPKNVTIMGQSAGGTSVHLLILSKMAQGLFHKAIIQSGCALNCWAISRNIKAEVAKILELNTTDEKTIINILKNLPVEELHSVQSKLYDAWDASTARLVGFTIEKNLVEGESFLSQHPLQILKSGNYNHVPIMIGYTSAEGMLVDSFRGKLEELNINFEKSVPHELKVEIGSQLSKLLAQKIKEFYFGNETPSRKMIDRYYRLKTDNFFFREIFRSVELHVATSSKPVYLYKMTLETDLNIFKTISGITAKGACHVDDIFYLFKGFIDPVEIEPDSIEDISRRRFCKLWLNFVKHGNPTPENDSLLNVKWEPVTKDEANYLEIDRTLVLKKNPDNDSVEFWKQLFELAVQKCKL